MNYAPLVKAESMNGASQKDKKYFHKEQQSIKQNKTLYKVSANTLKI